MKAARKKAYGLFHHASSVASVNTQTVTQYEPKYYGLIMREVSILKSLFNGNYDEGFKEKALLKEFCIIFDSDRHTIVESAKDYRPISGSQKRYVLEFYYTKSDMHSLSEAGNFSKTIVRAIEAEALNDFYNSDKQQEEINPSYIIENSNFDPELLPVNDCAT